MDTQKYRPTRDIRHSVIEAALPDVVFDGWNLDHIKASAEQAGFTSDEFQAAFPKGMTDILDSFSDYADVQMIASLSDTDPETLPVRERVKVALMARFDFLNAHKEAVKASLKFWINPLRKATLARIIWRSADVIWDWSGDMAQDYNRYTKRGLLSGIMSSATLVWLNDHSEDMSKTERFIDGRIANVMSLGKVTGAIKSKVGACKSRKGERA